MFYLKIKFVILVGNFDPLYMYHKKFKNQDDF